MHEFEIFKTQTVRGPFRLNGQVIISYIPRILSYFCQFEKLTFRALELHQSKNEQSVLNWKEPDLFAIKPFDLPHAWYKL